MNARMFVALVLFAAAGCSALPSTLKPYRDNPPAGLLGEVDRRIYTPASRGLRHMEADLLIDVAGFVDAKSRPKTPLWLPVHFQWEQGNARFEARNWPDSMAKLKQRVLAMLQGKEDDLVGRPFIDRLNGFRLRIEDGDDGLLWIVAVHPSDPERRWRLGIDGEFHVRRTVIEVNERQIASDIDYGAGSPAVMTGIATQESGAQPVQTSVHYEYGRTGKYTLPRRIVYQSTVGRVAFPPLTIDVKNVKVE